VHRFARPNKGNNYLDTLTGDLSSSSQGRARAGAPGAHRGRGGLR
jgi:hypothetical protein